jgi:hypothetical protein
MNASRGMYIRNIAHIILNLEYIRHLDINELSEMPKPAFKLKIKGRN